MKHDHHWKSFSLRIIVPTLVAIILFVVSMFIIIIPSVQRELLEDKREMIRELTNSAWSILDEQHTKEKLGLLTKQEAQKRAVEGIRCLRYGKERKDYFWITDTAPVMIMHPYRDDLNGTNLSEYTDMHEKKLFVEMVDIANKYGDGFVNYMWQWKDDQTRIVPKISYVKSFPPWGWIIGTGIYYEDVKDEIAGMSSMLMKISSGITLLIALILLFITLESMKIERKREQAEKDLQESEKKYRTLVEAATEGVLMFIEGRLVHANKPVATMLGYEQTLSDADLQAVFAQGQKGYRQYRDAVANRKTSPSFEAMVRTSNGTLLEILISVATITFEGKDGCILTLKDISSNKKIEEELGLSRQRYQSLTDNLHIGVFRIDSSRKGNFVEANPATAEIFGFTTREQLFSTAISDLFIDAQSWKDISALLKKEGFVKKKVVLLKRHDGTGMVVSLSLGQRLNDEGGGNYYEGIMEDITERKKLEHERENLIVELQTSLLFINQPIKEFTRSPLTCRMSSSIRTAAEMMKKNKQHAIVIQTEQEDAIGIVTDYDITRRVVAENMPPDKPVYEIMSSPIISVPDDALIFEAVLVAQNESVQHLLTRDDEGRINGIIDNQDILHFHRFSSSLLIREISEAESIEAIIEAHKRLPKLIKTLIDSGAKSENITKLISKVSDLINEKIITFAINELGPPPTEFAFVALGSEGRAEQTLVTDQDNSIIFKDVGEDQQKETHAYFMKLGERVCGDLDRVGYALCKGDIMARNPKWCQPLAVWKGYFHHWITGATAQDLLEINIFFDFRSIYGSERLTDELRQFTDNLLQQNRLFFINFAQNALLYKPPIGFFGNIVVDSSDKKSQSFNIKNAMKLLLNFSRIYALQHQVDETNTIMRLKRLHEMGILKKAMYNETIQVYNYLMQIRLKHQATMIDNNLIPNNFINLKALTDIEQTMLKGAFSHLTNIQTKISFDFKGSGS
ncbi:MAG: cache domain-containing protein [Deltaproteobacteria bacterium]|nr:cache domain-containing protein [Candidatus Anaeroferrophillus wilburensis]MBN2889370.1 cache domain-containing protein [Deltaproteobacteria bacterium]